MTNEKLMQQMKLLHTDLNKAYNRMLKIAKKLDITDLDDLKPLEEVINRVKYIVEFKEGSKAAKQNDL